MNCKIFSKGRTLFEHYIQELKTLDLVFVRNLSLIFGVTLAFLSILSVLSAWLTKLVISIRAFINRPKKQMRLLIIPTSEEIAKYSVKIPDRVICEESVQEKMDRSEFIKKLEYERLKDEVRIVLLALIFILAFMAVGIQFIFIATQ